ncbi:helicase domino-like, partial [Musca vetustissima]|uniref:helicase domino-like n=1 Tax=Musca vetustissima TaxID=27455 RepID=UPI002AB729D8
SSRRLLLTGTPLQNDLMELWSLMHFLMPYVFSSHREFKEWFSNPMTGMIEGNMEYNETLIQRLHKVIRPFLLRRLKKEVEKQMPKKYEHVVMCRLSNRQRYLYDDFMSRAKTKETLQTGNLLSVINILMQLRKVCNHPNMFEVRPTISPFQMEGITFETSRLVCDLMEYDPFTQIDLHSLNLLLIELELTLTAYVSHKSRLLAAPRKLIEEIDSLPDPPPRCPTGKYKFHIRIRDTRVQQNISAHSQQMVKVGASPAMKMEGNKFVPLNAAAVVAAASITNNMGFTSRDIVETGSNRINKRINNVINPIGAPKLGPITPGSITRSSVPTIVSSSTSSSLSSPMGGPTPAKQMRLQDPLSLDDMMVDNIKTEKFIDDKALVKVLAQQVKTTTNITCSTSTDVSTLKTEAVAAATAADEDNTSELDPIFNMSEILQQRKEQRLARLKLMANVNKRRTDATPIYGADCRESIEHCSEGSRLLQYSTWQTRGYTNCNTAMHRSNDNWTLNKILKNYEKRCQDLKHIFQNYVIYVPSACAPRIRFYVNNLASVRMTRERAIEQTIQKEMSPKLALLHPIISAMTTQFPDPRLIQYDCGKLQTLDGLLKQLKYNHHRVLIFTQMTKMLDVLEAFLNYHGHIYLRLDGATKVEQRQILMERFNTDKRIFCFILSTRSGGVGINLTGADTVIFYDSDWNPTMDAQAQDRCHRIGQTRDVHIYRLVSEKTIEVNILKKANQKRMLSDMAIEGGNFTTSYFKSSTIKDLFNVDTQQQQQGEAAGAAAGVPAIASSQSSETAPSSSASSTVVESNEIDLEKQSLKAFESALAAAEDEQDVQAAKTARAEAAADLAEFDENIPLEEVATNTEGGGANVELSKADLEMQNLVKQLSPIERYAMRFVEETGAAWTAEQLRAAEEELEAQKREWEANRLAALQKEEEMLKQEAENDEMLTYSRKDATNQVNRQKTNVKTNSKRTNMARNRDRGSATAANNKRRRLQQLRNSRNVNARTSTRRGGAAAAEATDGDNTRRKRRISSRQQQQQQQLNVQKNSRNRTTSSVDRSRQRRQHQQKRGRTTRLSGGIRKDDSQGEQSENNDDSEEEVREEGDDSNQSELEDDHEETAVSGSENNEDTMEEVEDAEDADDDEDQEDDDEENDTEENLEEGTENEEDDNEVSNADEDEDEDNENDHEQESNDEDDVEDDHNQNTEDDDGEYESQQLSRRSRLRSLRGSFTKKSPKVMRRKSLRQSLDTSSSHATNRKTTRTSMAAARAAAGNHRSQLSERRATSNRNYLRSRQQPVLRSRGGKTMKPQDDDESDEDNSTK